MQYFVSLLIFFLLLSLTTRLKGWRRIITVVALIAMVFMLLILWHDDVILRGSRSWWRTSPFKEILLFAAMVGGMSAKYLWDLIEVRRSKMKTLKGQNVPLGFDGWDFFQPLLVAGIVFSGVLATLKEMDAPTVLLSFQNGFFWQTVLKRKVGL
jgi:hypothetical protein